jgi:uncharacterized protein with NAD-binding domain and iron-sulfur cluster
MGDVSDALDALEGGSGMKDLVRHAFKLERMKAPVDAQAMGMLAAWHTTRSHAVETKLRLAEADFADNVMALRQHPLGGDSLPPAPLAELLDFDRDLPASMRFEALSPGMPGLAAQALDEEPEAVFDSDASSALSFEGVTPVLKSPLPFADALRIADFPAKWASATVQMWPPVPDPVELLPRDGARWRARLRKRTDFGKPLATKLVCDETIEITAYGHGETSGSRRYTYFLYASHDKPGYPRVFEDAGWIELSGDESGTQIRIKKRVRVSRPTDEALSQFLAAGFMAELWLWAAGFNQVAGVPEKRPKAVPLPATRKHVVLHPLPVQNPPPKKGGKPPISYEMPPSAPPGHSVHVAILGGGPAGLACAWLLSNPVMANGKRAWESGSARADLELELTIVERQNLPGGKAASARQVDGSKTRLIQEHGLHVLMGFYANVLGIVKLLGTESLLVDTPTLRVPADVAPGDVASAWEIAIHPWSGAPARAPAPAPAPAPAVAAAAAAPTAKGKSRASTKSRQTPESGAEAEAEEMVFERSLEKATKPSHKPLLRSLLFLNRQVRQLATKRGAKPAAIASPYHAMVMKSLAKSLSFAPTSTKSALAWSNGDEPELGSADSFEQIGALARLLRQFSRAALAQGTGAGDHLAAEALELGTTMLIGLQDHGLLPIWAFADPAKLSTDSSLGDWALSLQQAFDSVSISQWLEDHGIAKGFVQRSRLLAALTAGVFSTPDTMAAGTFIHGVCRLVLDFQGAPFKRMRGGTGEVLIAPMFEALEKKKVEFRFGTSVAALKLAEAKDGMQVVAATLRPPEEDQPGMDFVPADARKKTRSGWEVQKKKRSTVAESLIEADAFVLALPPFQAASGAQAKPLIDGLPASLQETLERIGSRATVSLQHWTTGSPLYPARIVAPFPGPMRCAAAMEHLAGDEGTEVLSPPVYYCGDMDDEAAKAFAKKDHRAWLSENAPSMQQGQQARDPFVSTNVDGSARYVRMDPATQAARPGIGDSGARNLWLAGDWTKGALSCGSIEHAVTSGLEVAADILRSLGCTVNYPIVGALPPPSTGQEIS